MVGEGMQVLCGGPHGKFSKLNVRSGPHTRSVHLTPSQSNILHSLRSMFFIQSYLSLYLTVLTRLGIWDAIHQVLPKCSKISRAVYRLLG